MIRGKWRAFNAQYATARGNVVRYIPGGNCVQVTLPQYHAHASYEIPLDRIVTARDFCGWVAHLSEKAWADEELIGAIVTAIDDVIGLRELK